MSFNIFLDLAKTDLLHCCWNKWFTIASYFNSLSTEDRTDVNEFLLEVKADVAVLR
jgi:hypothetical protein